MASITWYILGIASLIALSQGASFGLSNVYNNNMVLQREPKSSRIWGYGEPGAAITVSLDDQQYFTTIVPDDEKWSVVLLPMSAGGPHVIRITHNSGGAEETRTLVDVMFGDVWVCSGQSNMQMQLNSIFNEGDEIQNAVNYQTLRLFQVTLSTSDYELDQLNGVNIAWANPTVDNVPWFSALCLLYGERLADSLGGVPIGLIDSTWGGTAIEAWSSKRVTDACGTPPNPGTDPNNNQALWNSMIHPLTHMSVRGAIWYQGESNAGYNADLYACTFKNMMDDWRNTFHDGNNGLPMFPFGFVQLGPFSGGGPEGWGWLRWHQTIDTGVAPNSNTPEAFLALAYDTTDNDSPTGDIHPRDKQTVAIRLANAAKNILGIERHPMNGPLVVSQSIGNGEALLTYDVSLTIRGSAGFTYRMPNWEWFEASVEQVSDNEVRVRYDSSATQLAYAWSSKVCEYMQCALYSQESNLPAQPWIWFLA